MEIVILTHTESKYDIIYTSENETKGTNMIINYELDFANFKAWSGAINTHDAIYNADKCEEMEQLLDELYPEGMTETQLNDMLWFDSEWIFEMLGIEEEEEEEEGE